VPDTPFFQGYEGTSRMLSGDTHEWYMEKRNYMLTRVRLFGARTETSSGTVIETGGFEVTYQAWPRDEFALYPTRKHVFGSSLGEVTFDVRLDSDLEEIDICIDNENPVEIAKDFQSFTFYEYDGTVQTLQTGCQGVNKVDLRRNRLIGFRVTEGDYVDGRRNIRAIGPILDYPPPCAETVLSMEPIDIIIAEVGQGIVKEPIFAPDTYSLWYFEQDGHSYCSDRTYTFSEERSWLSADDSTLRVTAEHALAPVDELMATLTISINGSPSSAT
jgi:hypothetical protein